MEAKLAVAPVDSRILALDRNAMEDKIDPDKTMKITAIISARVLSQEPMLRS
jgi:hypothetical protein